MPKKAKELTPLQVKRLADKPGFWAVGGVAGLHLQVTENASSWILRIVMGGKRVDLGCGGYPDVSLAEAREKARQKRSLVEQGVDPRETRRAAKAALRADVAKNLTFDQAARMCHAMKSSEFRNAKHSNDWINSLTRYAGPIIGTTRVCDIDLPSVVRVLEPIWHTKTETATRVRERIEGVLAWATVNEYRKGENPARWKGNLEHALAKPTKIKKVEHHAAIAWQEIGAFMAELRKREGIAARALEFAILTAARSGEVRGATWDEIDMDGKLWTIAALRMKGHKRHRVPLSAPAIGLLKSIPRMEGSPYIFSAPRGGMLSDMSLSAVTRRMGVDAVPHGFRSSFKDWARSSTAYPDEVSELALAHVSSDETRAAYARDELLPKRALMMRDWAKYCATIPKKASVSPIGARA